MRSIFINIENTRKKTTIYTTDIKTKVSTAGGEKELCNRYTQQTRDKHLASVLPLAVARILRAHINKSAVATSTTLVARSRSYFRGDARRIHVNTSLLSAANRDAVHKQKIRGGRAEQPEVGQSCKGTFS